MATIEQGLKLLAAQIDELESERLRLIDSTETLRLVRLGLCATSSLLCLLDPGEIETRIGAVETMINSLEVNAERMVRIERQAQAGDVVALQRALNAQAVIIDVVRTVRPEDDLLEDTAQLVKDLVDDAAGITKGLGFGLGGVALGLAALFVVTR